jgi:uncharacterized membrane protein (DUF485 family)
MTKPERPYMKGFVQSLSELFRFLAVLLAFLALFLCSAYHPAVGRIVCFALSGIMFGFVVMTLYLTVQDYFDALERDRVAEEFRMKKLAEDVMES